MPTPLHKELTWHKEEVALCKKVLAEIETRYPPSPQKDEALARVRATQKIHEDILVELEKKLAQGV